ncbi:glutamine--fructose-6-phosphate transaminase (isomerizing) [Cobetia sp. ICG0124]|uniref:glutamine--fructose-6-phosphate transaminase (isomerizing) n=1 Tax=Cobetia sp. ICG0124 TaxID=2053669 RepID=UPI001F0B8EA9|nr:glutamine--fructose-6-phosphate transaminase (isomerizing) [Cobetia sp. ICG0124]
MCGIVGAVASRNVQNILLEGLHRLEYRGYDSAGMAVLSEEGRLNRVRALGKVAALQERLEESPLKGRVGIAHTRWATHGAPSEANAHPHQSGDSLAVVHNGIIENYETLKRELQGQGYVFTSETDTEVVAHLLAREYTLSQDLLTAVQKAVALLDGAFALGVVHRAQPDVLIGARQGSPLVIGVGIDEHFLASDQLALLQVTDRFIYLKEGDLVRMTAEQIEIFEQGERLITEANERPVQTFEHAQDAASKGDYRHFMLKEIHEQSRVLAATLEGRLNGDHVLVRSFGSEAENLFRQVKQVQIVACGTSYHAGMVARYWIEDVWPAFRRRSRSPQSSATVRCVVADGTLFVTLSQSGETADTLSALRAIQKLNRESLQAGHYLGESGDLQRPGQLAGA